MFNSGPVLDKGSNIFKPSYCLDFSPHMVPAVFVRVLSVWCASAWLGRALQFKKDYNYRTCLHLLVFLLHHLFLLLLARMSSRSPPDILLSSPECGASLSLYLSVSVSVSLPPARIHHLPSRRTSSSSTISTSFSSSPCFSWTFCPGHAETRSERPRL